MTDSGDDMSSQEEQDLEGPTSSEADLKEDFESAKSQIRGTLKWVMSVFGAVGGVLVAGVPLSAIAGVELFSTRFWFAVVGAGIALLAAMGVVGMAARVLGGPGFSLVDIARSEQELFAIPEDLRVEGIRKQSFLERYENHRVVEYLRGQPQLLGPYESINALATRGLDQMKHSDAGVEPRVERLIEKLNMVGGWQQVSRRYRTALTAVLIGTGVIAVGLLVFTSAAFASEMGEPTQPQALPNASSEFGEFESSVEELTEAMAGLADQLDKSLMAESDSDQGPQVAKPENGLYGTSSNQSHGEALDYLRVVFDDSVAEEFALSRPCSGNSEITGALEETFEGDLRVNVVPSDNCDAFAIDMTSSHLIRGYPHKAPGSSAVLNSIGPSFDSLVVVDPEMNLNFQDLVDAGCGPDDISTAFLRTSSTTTSGVEIGITIPQSQTCPGADFDLKPSDYIWADSSGVWIEPGS